MAAPQPSLFYLVDWLPPDFGAVGQYGLLYAAEHAGQGRQVFLLGLTSGPATIERREFPGGGRLEIHRLPGSSYDKTRNLARLRWTLAVNARLVRAVIAHRRSRRADLLFTGAPPLMLYFAIWAKWLRGARLIYRITDFHPEAMLAELGRRPLALRLLQRLTWFLRRRVDAFEVLGEDQRNLLLRGGVPADRITLKRDVPPVAISGTEAAMARPSGLAGRRVLLYSGNLGAAHDVETMLDGLVLHHRKGSGRFALWLNATGRNVDRVVERLAAEGVPFACTRPGPVERLPALLAAADAHLVTLRPQFSGIVLPSKIYACIASRRPIVFVGPESSDVHLLSRGSGVAYEHVAPGDAAGFARALERLADLRERATVAAE